MIRLALTAVACLTVLLLAAPADAFQCPKLVKQLQDATATRFELGVGRRPGADASHRR